MSATFYDLLAEIQRRYGDLESHNAAFASECDRLRNIVEGLLGVLGKTVPAEEIGHWRKMAGLP